MFLYLENDNAAFIIYQTGLKDKMMQVLFQMWKQDEQGFVDMTITGWLGQLY